MKETVNLILLIALLFVMTTCKKDSNNNSNNNNSNNTANCGNVTDADGNVYNSVTIGTQCWLQQNLKTTKYNDGSTIPNVTDNTAWKNLNTPAYCWYNDSAVKYKSTYGALYNLYAVNTGKLCPAGWHIPDSTEWVTLVNYLGGWGVAGGKMKEAGITHWLSPNTEATNSSGFTALPGGARVSKVGAFGLIESYGYWWAASEGSSNDVWGLSLRYSGSGIARGNAYTYVTDGFSVRCVKN